MGLLDQNYKDQKLTDSEKKKIKPAIQGGGPNYLGKQETVTVPKKWLSDPDHVVAELAYITPKEKKILLEKNLYGSLKGKPNTGPAGIQSLQGDMGGTGGSSGGGNSGGGGGGGGGGGRDYSSVPASKPSTKPSAPPGGGSTSLGSGRDYSPPSSSIVGNNNTVDHGFQQALKEQAKRQSDPVYGDPDPQVDVDPRDRDSITSFKDNYIANVKSNPMYLGIGGLLHTAYQTGKAKSMLSGVPGYEFLDYSDGNNNVPTIAGGGGENTTALLAASPYIVSGTTPVESQASKWYNSIGNNTKQFNFASAYATAKAKVSQTLNNKGPIGMLAVSDSPYYDWLKTNKLDRGIL
jgi:hypothetical protein